KFTKTGVFSAMNNLEDVSMDDRYAAMLGYTEEELLTYFDGHIEETAARLGKTKDGLITDIRDYYDGFSFDGKTMLYNPFSTLNFFKKPAFKNYWFESGTPSFIARYMKERKLTVEQFRGFEVSRDFASYPGEIESSTAASFLYQSGYLSLRPGLIEDYSLDYPNREVHSAMSALLTMNILGSDTARASVTGLKAALIGDDVAIVVREFNRLLASIPYDDYNASVREHFEMRNPRVNFGEWLYRSTLLSYLYGAGLRVEAETHGHRGRPDIVVEFRGRVWVMELKMAKDGMDAGKLAEEAISQIVEKGYAAPFAEATLLGLVIDDERRSIEEYRVQLKGQGQTRQ
ncbi:MAG: ATP-binding protein, partial [Synergistaceae bacterium]|nr:ATP-binding protein [Synergistaceae bacterium]